LPSKLFSPKTWLQLKEKETFPRNWFTKKPLFAFVSKLTKVGIGRRQCDQLSLRRNRPKCSPTHFFVAKPFRLGYLMGEIVSRTEVAFVFMPGAE
jgi:hypothetical protein